MKHVKKKSKEKNMQLYKNSKTIFQKFFADENNEVVSNLRLFFYC